jgi:hypothetical protein
MTQPLRLIQPEQAAEEHPQQGGATVVLTVRLAGTNGERWEATGIGSSHAEALTWALESAPAGPSWLVCSWSDTYGD